MCQQVLPIASAGWLRFLSRENLQARTFSSFNLRKSWELVMNKVDVQGNFWTLERNSPQTHDCPTEFVRAVREMSPASWAVPRREHPRIMSHRWLGLSRVCALWGVLLLWNGPLAAQEGASEASPPAAAPAPARLGCNRTTSLSRRPPRSSSSPASCCCL